MPLPTIAGAVRCTFSGLCAGGGAWSNTFHIRRIDLGAPTDAEITTAASLFSDFYTAAYVPYSVAATTLTKADFVRLDGTSGGLAFSWGHVGGDTANPTLPPECAGVLTIRTAIRGRQNRGRVFMPPATQGSLTVGKFTAGYASAVVSAAATLRSALLGADWELGVGSYGPYKNPTTGITDSTGGGTTSPHFTACTTVTMDVLVDVIRSRKN